MNKKIVLLALASVFMLSAVIGAQLIVAAAVQRTVGVSEGDWAEYDVTYSGNATMMMPPPNETVEWMKITVQNISGTNITFQTIARYADTHNTTGISVIDVDMGQGNASGVLIAANLIAANLNAGDLIYTSPPSDGLVPENATINETISRTYLGETVEINHLNITTIYTGPETRVMVTTTLNAYWYRTSGMLAEFSVYELTQLVGGNTTWLEIKAVISDIIPKFPPALILPLFMIALLTVATLTAVWLGKKIWSTKKSIKKPSPCA